MANSRRVNGSNLKFKKKKKLKRNRDVPVSCFCVALFMNSFWYHISFSMFLNLHSFLDYCISWFCAKKKTKEKLVQNGAQKEIRKIDVSHWFCVAPRHCMYGANQRICVNHIRHSGSWKKKQGFGKHNLISISFEFVGYLSLRLPADTCVVFAFVSFSCFQRSFVLVWEYRSSSFFYTRKWCCCCRWCIGIRAQCVQCGHKKNVYLRRAYVFIVFFHVLFYLCFSSCVCVCACVFASLCFFHTFCVNFRYSGCFNGLCKVESANCILFMFGSETVRHKSVYANALIGWDIETKWNYSESSTTPFFWNNLLLIWKKYSLFTINISYVIINIVVVNISMKGVQLILQAIYLPNQEMKISLVLHWIFSESYQFAFEVGLGNS